MDQKTMWVAIGIVLLISIVKSLILPKNKNWTIFSKGYREGHELSSIFVGLSIFTSLAGGFMVFGLVQVGFEGGLSGYILGLAYIIGLPLLAVTLPKVEKKVDIRYGMYVIDELIFKYYGAKSLLAFYIMSVLVFSGVLGGQLLAINFYLQKFSDFYSYFIVLIIGLLGTVIYTILGGFRSVLQNDSMQAILVLLVSIIFPVSLYFYLQNLDGAIVRLNYDDIRVGGDYGIVYPIVGGMFLLFSFVVRPDLWQRVRLVQKKKRIRALIISAFLLTWFYVSMTTAGLWIFQNYSLLNLTSDVNPGEYVVALLDNVVVWPILQIFVLVGILFALLSSIDSYLNLVALCLTKVSLWQSIPKVDGLTEDEDLKHKKNAQASTLIVIIVAIVLAVLIPDLVELLSASFAIMGVLIPVAGWAIFSKSHKASDWVGATTIWLSLGVLVIAFPFLRELAFIPAVVMANIVFIVLLLIDKKMCKV